MTSPFDAWKTTDPDLERVSWVNCTACGYLFEPEDCEYMKDEEDEGICCGCWKAGERPEGWDGEE